jgi:IS5 family transposase
MQPRERRETGARDLFRSRLDQIIDMKHPLVALGRTVDWEFLDGSLGRSTRMIRAARHCRRD